MVRNGSETAWRTRHVGVEALDCSGDEWTWIDDSRKTFISVAVSTISAPLSGYHKNCFSSPPSSFSLCEVIPKNRVKRFLGLVRFGSVTVWSWNGGSDFGSEFPLQKYSLTGIFSVKPFLHKCPTACASRKRSAGKKKHPRWDLNPSNRGYFLPAGSYSGSLAPCLGRRLRTQPGSPSPVPPELVASTWNLPWWQGPWGGWAWTRAAQRPRGDPLHLWRQGRW